MAELLIAIALLCGSGNHLTINGICQKKLTLCMINNEGQKKSEPLDLSLAKCVAGLKQ